MIREYTANCPHCGEPDTTCVPIEDYTTEYFIVTECVTCTKPYVIGTTIIVEFRTGRVDMEQNNA